MSATVCPTNCFLDACIRQASCDVFVTPGFSRLWLANTCDIATKIWDTLAGDPLSLLAGLTLKPGKYLYTVDFLTKTGLQFDTNLVRNASYSWDNVMVADFISFDARSQSIMRKMIGAKLFAIAQGDDNRLYAMGIGKGLEVATEGIAHGRISSDAKLITITWNSSDNFGQREVNFYSTGNKQDDLDMTVADLDALVDPLCAY